LRKSRRAEMPARFSWSTSFQRQPDLYSFMAIATRVFAHEIIRFSRRVAEIAKQVARNITSLNCIHAVKSILRIWY